MRDRMLALIGKETENVRAGKPAGIRAKLNNLTDTQVIMALYEASRAGVRIQLCVRGSCCLRPGVPGMSDNISVAPSSTASSSTAASTTSRTAATRWSTSRRPTG